MMLVLFYGLFIAAAFLYLEINRRYLLLSVILTFLVIILFPFVADSSDWNWFDWIKRYLVCTPIFFFALAQFANSKKNKKNLHFFELIGIYLLPFIILLNILEASVYDLLNNHIVNGIVGIITLLTIPKFWFRWHFDDKHILGFGEDDVSWILLYSIWNATFATNNYGIEVINTYIPGILILIIAILFCICYRRWHWWIFARAYTLQLTLLTDSFFPSVFPNVHLAINKNVLIIMNTSSALLAMYVLYQGLKKNTSLSGDNTP